MNPNLIKILQVYDTRITVYTTTHAEIDSLKRLQ